MQVAVSQLNKSAKSSSDGATGAGTIFSAMCISTSKSASPNPMKWLSALLTKIGPGTLSGKSTECSRPVLREIRNVCLVDAQIRQELITDIEGESDRLRARQSCARVVSRKRKRAANGIARRQRRRQCIRSSLGSGKESETAQRNEKECPAKPRHHHVSPIAQEFHKGPQ